MWIGHHHVAESHRLPAALVVRRDGSDAFHGRRSQHFVLTSPYSDAGFRLQLSQYSWTLHCVCSAFCWQPGETKNAHTRGGSMDLKEQEIPQSYLHTAQPRAWLGLLLLAGVGET